MYLFSLVDALSSFEFAVLNNVFSDGWYLCMPPWAVQEYY